MGKKILIGVIYLALLMLNSGCFGLVKHDYNRDKPKVVVSENSNQSITTNNGELYDVPKAECTDEVVTTKKKKSDCDADKIDKSQLVKQPQKGELHTLTSIRKKVIRIGERSNGFTFPNYSGKVMILEMFGKDCPHCLNQLPVLKKIRKRYRGKLEVIAIQSQGRMSRAVASSYINRHKITYPIIEGEDATNLQYFIQSTYGWNGILPYTLVIKNGVTEFAYSGEVSYKDMRADIDSLF